MTIGPYLSKDVANKEGTQHEAFSFPAPVKLPSPLKSEKKVKILMLNISENYVTCYWMK